jgi:hypothetical protein
MAGFALRPGSPSNLGYRRMAMEGLTERERYRFDLDGFVIRRGVLDAGQLRALNTAVDGLRLPTPGESIASQRFNGHLTRALEFRDLIDHDSVLGIVADLCGPMVRLDHAYGLVMSPGTRGLGLHGGATPHDPSQYYEVRDGRMYNGLVAAQWALVDQLGPHGGLCCMPGSHRAAFTLPSDAGDMAQHIELAAGDLMVFTEALTHGTTTWHGPHQRRSLFYKYAPGHIAWGNDYHGFGDMTRRLTDRQRRLIQPPSIYTHERVV